jgi:phosphomevalonate kinase
MIARAPGKLVLSGAYSVLEGAPALVAAVDRYAIADDARDAPLITAEVRAAIEAGDLARAPWFDASALRQTSVKDGLDRKLGLGSSAAILVASLAACAPPDAPLPLQGLFERALTAHRAAQGGGSGVDVAASVFGGVLACRLGISAQPPRADDPRDASTPAEPRRLDVRPHALPPGILIDVFASPVSAETRSLLAEVRAFAARDPSGYRAIIDRASSAAEHAVMAVAATDLVSAIAAQAHALAELGRRAGAPIVTEDIAAIIAAAELEGAAFCPSGAGGGDIAIFVGGASPSPSFVEFARARGLERIELRIGAPGVSRSGCGPLLSTP